MGVTVLRTSPEEIEKSLAGILCNVELVYDFTLAAIDAMICLNFFDGDTRRGDHWVGKPYFLIMSPKYSKTIDCQDEPS